MPRRAENYITNHKEFMTALVARDWKAIERFMAQNKKNEYKILASAVIEVYCWDDEKKQKLGMGCWSKRLGDGYENSFSKLWIGSVDLLDFQRALWLAGAGIGTERGFADSRVQECIRDFVRKPPHIHILGKILSNPQMPSDFKKILCLDFGIVEKKEEFRLYSLHHSPAFFLRDDVQQRDEPPAIRRSISQVF